MLEFFPQLAVGGFLETSPVSAAYNCIAWAAGDTGRWWWPDAMNTAYWPPETLRAETLEAFAAAFATLGYAPCSDGAVAGQTEKVAIYAKAARPTHRARQLPDGRWTSKLGQDIDLTHDLAGLEGDLYGLVALFLSRPR
jgi:hypothetical protein